MQLARMRSPEIASILALVTAVAAVSTSSAFAQARHSKPRRAAQPLPGSMAPKEFPCTAQRCELNPKTGVSTLHVVPKALPGGGNQSFTAPASSNPAQGMLHRAVMTGKLSCGGYNATDPDSVQFYLGDTTLADITYDVTDTIKSANSDTVQFCLGARYKFTTLSGKRSRPVTLPNGLSGFVGLLPSCDKVTSGPCVVSRGQLPSSSGNGYDAVLKLRIPAIGGDPWGRA